MHQSARPKTRSATLQLNELPNMCRIRPAEIPGVSFHIFQCFAPRPWNWKSSAVVMRDPLVDTHQSRPAARVAVIEGNTSSPEPGRARWALQPMSVNTLRTLGSIRCFRRNLKDVFTTSRRRRPEMVSDLGGNLPGLSVCVRVLIMSSQVYLSGTGFGQVNFRSHCHDATMYSRRRS